MQAILTIVFYIFFLAFTVLFFLLMCVAFVVTVPFDRSRAVLHWLSKLWTRCYFGAIPSWWVKTEGMENIEKGKQYVVIVNHRSMLDILIMYVLPFNFKWVSKKEVYKWPLFGWVLWLHGDIAIERGTAKAVRQMIREGRQWMDKGCSVIIFPEGSRGKEDGVGRFREGAFMMAKETGAEILPCVALGTGTAFNGWKLNFRNRFRVRVLPPVSHEQVQATELKDMARQMQELISRNYAEMKKEQK